MTTTPLDFIASLEHGEAKAAALTVYNLTQANPSAEWIEITHDPTTLPETGKTVVVCMNADSGGGQMFGLRDGPFPESWQWYHSKFAYWNTISHSIQTVSPEIGRKPTHWRSIS
jgi:hypothetical protein